MHWHAKRLCPARVMMRYAYASLSTGICSSLNGIARGKAVFRLVPNFLKGKIQGSASC
jgi:hypothetical protein